MAGKPSVKDSRILVLNGDYRRMDETIEAILQTFAFPWENRRVLIKPNMLGPHAPEKGITTHPSMIRSLVKSLKKRHAQCLVGDNPGMGGYTANEYCATVSGLREAADGCFVNLAQDAVPIPISSRWIKRLVVSKAVLDADLIINVPKFKTHLQTRITGAIKNMFGILAGAEKARAHLAAARPRDFSEVLVDIYQLRPPDLTIMDAVVGMEGNGPASGDLRSIGKVLAGANGVSVDGLMAAMMGIAAKEVDMLRIAGQRGLGEIDPRNMEIQGSWSPLEKFKMPLSFVSQGLWGTLLNKTLYRPWRKPRLRVNSRRCSQCEVCIRHCPAQAMTLGPIPTIRLEKCISCYCCLELCPNQAIELTGLLKRMSGGKKNLGS